PVFGQAIPLVGGITYGDVFGYLQTVQTTLGRLRFASAQEIADTLIREFGLSTGSVVANFDAEKRELTFHLALDQAFSLRPALAGTFGDLNGMTADAALALTGRTSVAFTFGVKLGGGQAMAERLFVRNFVAGGEIHLSGAALQILGRLGFLQF